MYTSNSTSIINSTSESTPVSFTSETPSMHFTSSDIWFIITISLRYLEITVTIAGNVLVLIAISRFTYLQTPVYWFICGLSLSDLLGIFLAPIIHFVLAYSNTMAARYVCHAKIMLMVLFGLGNLLFSLLIALERLITLSYPLIYKTIITDGRVINVFIFSWIYLLLSTAMLPISSHHGIMTLESLECNPALVMPTLSSSIIEAQIYSTNLGKIKIYNLFHLCYTNSYILSCD